MPPIATMAKEVSLRSWDWLGSGRAYERVRRALILFFAGNACGNRAEELTDEVFERVEQRLLDDADFIASYVGDPARYFQGVARNVLKEARRPQPVARRLPPEEPMEVKEIRARCLDRCLKELSEPWRSIILEYYQAEGAEKKRMRRNLAQRLETSLNALRIRMFKLRHSLRKCVKSCLLKETDFDFGLRLVVK